MLDERLAFALRLQLLEWRAELATGAERVGWKIGRGIVTGLEHLEPVIGYLTTATRLEPGGVYRAGNARELMVDAEIAVEVGTDGEPSGFAAALELVDTARPPDDFESIVAGNVWHRAFVLSPAHPNLPGRIEARITVNDELRDSAEATHDLAASVARAAFLLASMGERLEAGDRILTGSIVQAPVSTGDEITVDLAELGQVGVRIG